MLEIIFYEEGYEKGKIEISKNKKRRKKIMMKG